MGVQVPPPTPNNHLETGQLFSYPLFLCRDSVGKKSESFSGEKTGIVFHIVDEWHPLVIDVMGRKRIRLPSLSICCLFTGTCLFEMGISPDQGIFPTDQSIFPHRERLQSEIDSANLFVYENNGCS